MIGCGGGHEDGADGRGGGYEDGADGCGVVGSDVAGLDRGMGHDGCGWQVRRDGGGVVEGRDGQGVMRGVGLLVVREVVWLLVLLLVLLEQGAEHGLLLEHVMLELLLLLLKFQAEFCNVVWLSGVADRVWVGGGGWCGCGLWVAGVGEDGLNEFDGFFGGGFLLVFSYGF